MAQRTVSQNHDRRQGKVDSQVHPNTQASFSYVVCRVRVIAATHRLGREQVERIHAERRRETLEVCKRRVRLPALDLIEIRSAYPATPGEIRLRSQRGLAKAANVSAEHRTEGRRRLPLKNATSVCLSHIHRFHTIRNRTGNRDQHYRSTAQSRNPNRILSFAQYRRKRPRYNIIPGKHLFDAPTSWRIPRLGPQVRNAGHPPQCVHRPERRCDRGLPPSISDVPPRCTFARA